MHRFRVLQRAKTVPQVKVTRGGSDAEWVAYADAHAQIWRNHLVATGYRVRTAEGLKTTPRGARLGAWRALFPWLNVIKWRQRRAAAALQRAFNDQR